jgi:hypothetical protein
MILIEEVGLIIEQRLREARYMGACGEDHLVGRSLLTLLHLLEVAGAKSHHGLTLAWVELGGVVAVEIVDG